MSVGNGNEDRLLTASEIAELAGVSPSAVSNWRRRFPDFPKPAGTAPGGGDLFRFEDVETWLRTRPPAKKQKRSPDEGLWAGAERLRGKALPSEVPGLLVLAAAFAKCARERDLVKGLPESPKEQLQWVTTSRKRLASERPDFARLFSPLEELEPEALALLLRPALAIENSIALASAVEYVIQRGGRYGDVRTPTPLAEFLVDLARPRGVVFDPAVGSGEFLLRAFRKNHEVALYGQELNENAWRIVVARLLLQGIEARVAQGDSLIDDAFPDLRADAILCEPPIGKKAPHAPTGAGLRQWQAILRLLDTPSTRAGEFAWLAHAITHLSENGRAYVVTGSGSLFRGGTESRLRSELLRQGTVEAIVTLPKGTLRQTVTAPALWVVRPPTDHPSEVLLIAADEPGEGKMELDHRITEMVRAWRRGQFKNMPGFAASVPVLDLLGGDVSLEPSRWVYEPDFVDQETLARNLRVAQGDLAKAHEQVPGHPPIFEIEDASESIPRVRIRDLIEQGLVELIRPSRLKTDEYTDEGVPVWLPADVRDPWDLEEAPKFADPERVDPRTITEPGDVVLTTIGGLRTRVDCSGGHVLGTSLHALRLQLEIFDPETVAALLTSEPNRRIVKGSTIPRVNVLELEIPLLDRAASAELAAAIRALHEHEAAGHKRARAAARTRQALVAAVSTGTVRIRIRSR